MAPSTKKTAPSSPTILACEGVNCPRCGAAVEILGPDAYRCPNCSNELAMAPRLAEVLGAYVQQVEEHAAPVQRQAEALARATDRRVLHQMPLLVIVTLALTLVGGLFDKLGVPQYTLMIWVPVMLTSPFYFFWVERRKRKTSTLPTATVGIACPNCGARARHEAGAGHTVCEHCNTKLVPCEPVRSLALKRHVDQTAAVRDQLHKKCEVANEAHTRIVAWSYFLLCALMMLIGVAWSLIEDGW